ncbi:hypothetical protein CBR_g41651 [Chara braunii]|uniref:Cupin type-1 domain-containing protein n=1 Tax=Chara braunii TaxID=69332 RepID=A0A388LWA3_CHABU|nr:hypothetical protein CBR_g41651 [Chara braunii]|eukprot:GBG86586.1 hypothetical protein CBR_g41651 [Chara braunii]
MIMVIVVSLSTSAFASADGDGAAFESGYGASTGAQHHEGRKGFFEHGKPKEVVKSEGGSLSVWSEFKELEAEGRSFAAAHLKLEENGFLLPAYPAFPHVLYAIEGSSYVGLMAPLGVPATMTRISKGEVLSIPRGWVFWICNHRPEGQEAERFEEPRGVENASSQSSSRTFEAVVLSGDPEHVFKTQDRFPLADAPRKHGAEGEETEVGGSILHGFSKDVLAAVWDVDESDVDKLLSSQSGRVIAKISKQEHPGLWEEMVSKLWRLEVVDTFTSLAGRVLVHHHERHVEVAGAAALLGEFVYDLDHSSPVVSNAGGQMRAVNRKLLPALGKYGSDFAVAVVELKQSGMVAPGWCVNADEVVYVTKGSGRIQIANPDGTNGLDAHVQPGSLIVIPRLHASVKAASKNEGLEMISFTTSALPFWSDLAGHNSVLHNMPAVAVKEAFNIPEDVWEKFRSSSTARYSIILPAPEFAKHE